jgi:hypothetical protein
MPRVAALKDLRVLGLVDTAITRKGIDTVRKALPMCRIEVSAERLPPPSPGK